MTVHTLRASAPERSIQQRMDALGRANRIRTRRAEVKRDLADDSSWSKLVELILHGAPAGDDPADFATMRVYEALLAARLIGRVKATRLLNRNRISPTKTLGGLTSRQRHELAVALTAQALHRDAVRTYVPRRDRAAA
jgi:hypothetical protein